MYLFAMIRILQISDIHFLDCESEDDKYALLRQKLFEDVDDLVSERGDVDVILTCGDVAFSGHKEEYLKARDFFVKLAKHAQCGMDNVFLVPGNHDVNWNSHQESRRLLAKALCDEKTNDETLKKWRTKEPLAIYLSHSPFQNYRIMAVLFGCVDGVSQCIIDGQQDFSKSKFYWKKEIGVLDGYKVYLYGMSTVLVSGENDFDEIRAPKGTKMFLPHCAYNITPKADEINISMMHHPTTHLLKSGEIERSLNSRFKVQLFGHTHIQSSDDQDVVKIHSGALQPDELDGTEYVPIYNLMELYVNDDADDGKRLVVDLYSRQGSDEGFVPYKGEFKRTLTVSLKHINRWKEATTILEANLDPQEEEETLQKTMNEINFEVLTRKNVIPIMEKMYKGFYDVNLSDMDNRLRFLQLVKREGKYLELSKLI